MKKVLFLLLFLVVLGAASVSAQVRIGGDEAPNDAAVLDLNVDDDTNTGTKGLALPRVNFSSNTAQITSGVANLTGMLVYNTNTTLGVGVYFWDAAKWVKLSDGSFVEVDGIVGNEVTNATTGGGLVRAGSGTTASPYTLGLLRTGASKGSIMMFNGTSWSITQYKEIIFWLEYCTACVNGGPARYSTTPSFPSGCTYGNTWLGFTQHGAHISVLLTTNELLWTKTSTSTLTNMQQLVFCMRDPL